MILEFSVENYRSFRDKQTFSMLPDEGKNEFPDNIFNVSEKYNLLTSAVIYGANASGKSNFMRALGAFHKLIMSGANITPEQDFSIFYDPFKFQSSQTKLPVKFQLDFLHDDVRYTYSVSFNKIEILEESLYYFPEGRKTKLFSREKDNFSFGDSLKGQKNLIKKITNKNQLYLSKAAQNHIRQLTSIYVYFAKSFYIIPAQAQYIDIFSRGQIIEWIKDSKVYKENFLKLIRSFDTGIHDFEFKKVEKTNYPNLYEINTFHKEFDDKEKMIGSIKQNFKEESTGTQKLFVLGGLILVAIMDGATILIDEFERSLHPKITEFLIDIFHNPEINKYGAQLIVATHDTNLLSGNELRRDQMWIVEKDNQGTSEMFSLADIKGTLKEANYEKWYLSGRFGGLPGIESLNFELNFKHETEEEQTTEV